jgi:hypothetical protein
MLVGVINFVPRKKFGRAFALVALTNKYTTQDALSA